MATKKKMLQAAAGQAGGAALDITDVFSTYLYDGTGSAQTITNEIDLAGEGGLVWWRARDFGSSHALVDTERGRASIIRTNSTGAATTSIPSNDLVSFNSDGFTLGTPYQTSGNNTGASGVSWTFRKAPKFFTCLVYTGDGTNGREISHDLGGTVGSIFVKKANADREWAVYHRSLGATHYGVLNNAEPFYDQVTLWNDTEPTSTHFTVGYNNSVNTDGDTYVAYLFAHNDGDGAFGPTGDQDVIKCGSYTGNGSSDGPEIDLGFEPQWVLVKCATAGGSSPAYEWYTMDIMRGMTGADDTWIEVNTSDAESSATYNYVKPEPTGFKISSGQSRVNTSGETYIYIAIRRGPLAPPESATEVFDVEVGDNSGPPEFTSGFPVDFALNKNKSTSSNWSASARLTGPTFLKTNTTDAEASGSSFKFDYQDGYFDNTLGSDNVSWMWKRSPGYFDVVAYSGTGSARTVSHNLGVAPEMMWVKSRTEAYSWQVYHEALGNRAYLALEENSAAQINTPDPWNNTSPTDTNFTLGASWFGNKSGGNYIAYLFASLDGISKVGSYTGTGSNQTIDCGFTSGARFVLIKRTNGAGSWRVYDAERGIVSGYDPILQLNTTSAEYLFDDGVDPDSSGFSLDSNAIYTNASGDSYIFYAIA